jgi:hypothetical protein
VNEALPGAGRTNLENTQMARPRLGLWLHVGNARRSNARPTVCEPHRNIRVLGVHLLASALNAFPCCGATAAACA